MKTQNVIAIIMILASSALTAGVSRDIAYPAILCMLGLLGLRRRFTWNIKPERRVITSFLMLLLAVLFALHFRYDRPTGWITHEQTIAIAWQTVTRYFLAGMILMLFLGSPERLPPSLGLFHLANTICAGQVLLLDDMFVAYRLLELLSVMLVVLYAATPRRSPDLATPFRSRRMPRWVVPGLILLAAANGGWVTGSILYRHVEVLDYVPGWFAGHTEALEQSGDNGSLIGFSNSGRLSSMLSAIQDQDPTVALTIDCDHSPGYLRARAFEVYRQSVWHDLSYKEAVFPEEGSPFGVRLTGRTSLFRLAETDPPDCQYMTVRHEFQFDGAAFTPMGVSSVEAPLRLLLRDDDGILYAPSLRSGRKYRIAYSPAPDRGAPISMQRHRMLDVPSQLDPRIGVLADRIFANSKTTAEKIEAVINHFRTNYTYSLGLEIPPGQDKLTYFLLEGSTGYCEYFASGAAMLLRLANVPTRYVTGFLSTQRSTQNGSWIARNMDAHAWAEAWDPEQRQWTIVEATVQQNQAVSTATEGEGPMGDGNSMLFGRFLQALYEYGLLGIPSWLYAEHALLAGVLVPGGLLGVLLGWMLSRHYRRKRAEGGARSPAANNPELVALRRMLARMDRRVKAAGLRRHLSETLHTFAQRLRAHDSGNGLWTRISDWYLEYANLRYGKTLASKQVRQLQQAAQGLHDSS